ncbi:phage tail protein I [Chitinivorax sp. B]|uniref:phage tail protein I n=1 Tax=Chitinivorax sp. B TaxID=2502235 RepID=UPI0010F46E8E|nr:phage tail protein I [Chitinivorax sp. B]
MTDQLLPPGTTPFERSTAAVLASNCDLPVPLRSLWNPASCPPALLPYLAWALSVDRWDVDWSDDTKRKVIQASFYVHQHKGTIGALRRVVEPLGYLIEVLEWWQTTPQGPPGTFRLRVGVSQQGITDAMYGELERVIDDAKPLSRHLLGLAISLETSGTVAVTVASYGGDVLTIYPYTTAELTLTGQLWAAGGSHVIDTLTIQGNP